MAAQSVYLSDNLSFSYTTDSRIATHLGNLVHVHGNETGFGTHLSGSGGGLATRVTRANNYHVILEIHTISKVTAKILTLRYGNNKSIKRRLACNS
jgi:hypothetical protein